MGLKVALLEQSFRLVAPKGEALVIQNLRYPDKLTDAPKRLGARHAEYSAQLDHLRRRRRESVSGAREIRLAGVNACGEAGLDRSLRNDQDHHVGRICRQNWDSLG